MPPDLHQFSSKSTTKVLEASCFPSLPRLVAQPDSSAIVRRRVLRWERRKIALPRMSNFVTLASRRPIPVARRWLPRRLQHGALSGRHRLLRLVTGRMLLACG